LKELVGSCNQPVSPEVLTQKFLVSVATVLFQSFYAKREGFLAGATAGICGGSAVFLGIEGYRNRQLRLWLFSPGQF
jgi:hypothetical protein